MLNTAWMARNLARALRRGSADLEAQAIERHVLCPAEEVPGRPALYPPGALERIEALSPWRDWQVERGLIEGVPIHHAATEALVVPDVVLAQGHLYRAAARARIGQGQARLWDPALPPRRDLPEAHLVATWTGADFFGNFMQDSLPLEMLPPEGTHAVGAPVKPYAHAAGYRALLDLPATDMPGHARIRRLTLYRDFAQNSLKEARYRRLRARLRRQVRRDGAPPPGIFLRRGQDGEPRALRNEQALAEMLAALGFAIIAPGDMAPDQIAAQALDARIVVAVEGSHLAHAIYAMADGGAFLVIQPPTRFAMPYKEYADRMGMAFGFVLGRPARDGFDVDLDEIRQMLDRLG